MDPRNDFLDIPSASRGLEVPMADFASANNPEAASIARARIASLIASSAEITDGAANLHPKILVTDRAELARAMPVRRVPRRVVPSALRPLLTAIGIFALVLLMFKAPVIWSQVEYSLNKPSATPTTLPVAGATVPAESTITIPKINVHVPIIYEPTVVEANVQKALESGVDHYGNTVMPGQNGNSVIFGHSSNDWWEPGNYKFVFVLLDKLAPGDQFSVDYQSRRYVYEVTSMKIVVPTDVSVLNQTAGPTMTLITCTPPGTSLNRLIVAAKLVSPVPTAVATTTATTSPATGSLPGSSTGFFDQIGHVINGIVQGASSLFGGASGSQTPTNTQIPAAK